MSLTLPRLTRGTDRAMPRVARSQAERLWLITGGFGALVLILIGYFFFIAAQRTKTGDVNSQVAAAKSQNAALQGRLAVLQAQYKDLPTYQAALSRVEAALPASSDVSAFLRTLQNIGGSTGTQITLTTVSAPVPVLATVASPTASPSPASTASASASGGTAAAAPLAYAMTITLTALGDADSLVHFVDQLQHVQPRAVLISQVGETQVLSGRIASTANTTLALTMQAFIKAPGAGAAGVPSAGSSSP